MAITDTNYDFALTVSDEEYEEALERKAEHVYNAFVQDVLNRFESRKIFQPQVVQEEMRPPYSYGEVKSALEYGAENSESVEFIEEDMDLFLYAED